MYVYIVLLALNDMYFLSLSGDRSLLRHSSLEQDGSRPKIDNKVFSHPSSSLSSSWDTSFRNWCRSTIKPLNADYTRSDIIRLGLLLCPIWLSSNLLYNYSLLLTSIASSTIIRYRTKLYS